MDPVAISRAPKDHMEKNVSFETPSRDPHTSFSNFRFQFILHS